VGLDQGHVRQVNPAHLVDAIGDLEQPLDRGELALPPQAWLHRLRRAALGGPPERVDIPDDPAVGVLDHAWLQARDQATVGVVEVGPVGEVGRHAGNSRQRVSRSALRPSMSAQSGRTPPPLRVGGGMIAGRHMACGARLSMIWSRWLSSMWPPPSTMCSRAVGHLAAITRVWATGTLRSAVPCQM